MSHMTLIFFELVDLDLEALPVNPCAAPRELPDHEGGYFKKGDPVICLDQEEYNTLETGTQYEINGITHDGALFLKDNIMGPYPKELFELVETFDTLNAKLTVHSRMTPSDNNGGSTDYYKLPEGAEDLQDLIEYKEMGFAQGNIFKAAWRMGSKGKDVGLTYDLNKIIWFAERMLGQLKQNNDTDKSV